MKCEYKAVKLDRAQAEETEQLLLGIGIERSAQDILASRCMIAITSDGEIHAMGEMLGQDKGKFWHFLGRKIGRKKKTRAIVAIRSVIFGCTMWENGTRKI